MKKSPKRMEIKSEIPFGLGVSVHIKVNWLKDKLFQEIDYIEPLELETALRRVQNYHFNLRRYLNESDSQLYEALKKIKIHPVTALRWISYTLLPEDIQKRKGISVKRSIRIAQNRNKQHKARLGLEIIGDIQRAIGALK